MLLANIFWFSLLANPAFVNPSPIDPVSWMQNVSEEMTRLYEDATQYTWLYQTGQMPTGQYFFRGDESLEQWRRRRCEEALGFPRLGELMTRAITLLCRGPSIVSYEQERVLGELHKSLTGIYSLSKLCLNDSACYSAEPDLENMARSSRDPDFLLWIWEGWRKVVAGPSLRLYPRFVDEQNVAARLNGYHDIGECWREELEVDDLTGEADRLLEEVRPFHRLLHAFVRHRLGQYYGGRLVSKDRPIPAHLLGGLWAQGWESLMDILVNSTLDLDKAVEKRYNKVQDMVLEAEKYYVSIGLEPMTDKFWKYSVVTKPDNPHVECHGGATNMYAPDDYRILVCASLTWYDFYVIHHEMGHIEYYMAYKDLPMLFKEATNSAFQESIGDLIMLAVETPEYMKRLGFIGQTEDLEIPILLHLALKKIPHLMFAYDVEKWRWGVMASNISVEDYNKVWWEYRTANEGIEPPVPRPPGSFDPISKFHIADNVPYIRYYLSDFLIFQYLDVLCQMKNEMYPVEKEDLHLCDLYGFKEAGEKLKLMMSHGSMYKWDKVLEEFSGGKYKKLSAEPLLKYFQPLIIWLEDIISKENIPVGW